MLTIGAMIGLFGTKAGLSYWRSLEVGCKTSTISDLPSPDGAFSAATVRRECMIGPSDTFVILRRAGDRLDEMDETGQVLVARDEPSFTVAWTEPTRLDIVLSGSVSLRSWSFVWRNVDIGIDGRNAKVTNAAQK